MNDMDEWEQPKSIAKNGRPRALEVGWKCMLKSRDSDEERTFVLTLSKREDELNSTSLRIHRVLMVRCQFGFRWCWR
jgi:hypothetical protein